MSTLSSANVTDVNLVLKERTHMRLCINMLIFTHNLGNWLMGITNGTGKGMGMTKPGDMNGNENYNMKRKGVGWKKIIFTSVYCSGCGDLRVD